MLPVVVSNGHRRETSSRPPINVHLNDFSFIHALGYFIVYWQLVRRIYIYIVMELLNIFIRFYLLFSLLSQHFPFLIVVSGCILGINVINVVPIVEIGKYSSFLDDRPNVLI